MELKHLNGLSHVSATLAGGWIAGAYCASLSIRKSVSRTVAQGSKRTKAELPALQSSRSGMGQCPFGCLMLVKASHRVSSDSRGGVEDGASSWGSCSCQQRGGNVHRQSHTHVILRSLEFALQMPWGAREGFRRGGTWSDLCSMKSILL